MRKIDFSIPNKEPVMKHLIVVSFIFIFFTGLNVYAQENLRKPKIIIGIVVDQMRQEYIYKYHDRYTEGGFKRLVNEGYMMKNAHFNYIPTFTGPGHASIYTGTTPATHGIIANNWYVRSLGQSIYCVSDSTVSYIGGSEKNGQISPRNLITTTITDELRLSTNKRSKVVGIALKDRGAVLPAGYLGDAYWYDGSTGEFMTSSYYRERLPDWVLQFNLQHLPQKYLDLTWETLYPIETYRQSIADANPFEGAFAGKEVSAFPYHLPVLMEKNDGLGLITSTPFGNTLTLDMAYAAIEGENLGKGEETDFLAISFSSTDYIGHQFGPTSIELEDNYLRLDKDLESFLLYLDQTYGEGEYLVFLTSDHGVAEVVEYLQSENLPAGRLDAYGLASRLNSFANERFGLSHTFHSFLFMFIIISVLALVTWIYLGQIKNKILRTNSQIMVLVVFVAFILFLSINEYHRYQNSKKDLISNYSNEQIYINRALADEYGLQVEEIQRALADYVITLDGIKEAYTASDLRRMDYSEGRAKVLQMGYNHKASGDVALILEPGWLSISWKGTTHGSGYNHDTHVPIIFYGWNIPHGESSKYCSITDIAPTLSMLLDLKLPNGSNGHPILPIVEGKKSL